jgi:azurin
MKKITLSIPEPCHENWNNMTPSQQGRFCGSCQKEVIDFTAMTDDELFRFFASKTTQNVCGRTLPDQLNTPLAKPAEHKKKKFWYISYLTSLLLFFSKSETRAQAKTPVTVSPIAKPTVVVLGNMTRIPVKEEVIQDFVSGKVINENGTPVPFASITIKSGARATAADEYGNFKIKAKKGEVAAISAVGFNNKDFTITTGVQHIVLTRHRGTVEGKIVVTAGLIATCSSDDYVAPDEPRHIAQLYVKESGSNNPIANAQLTIVRNNQSKQKKRKRHLYHHSFGKWLQRAVCNHQRRCIPQKKNG